MRLEISIGLIFLCIFQLHSQEINTVDEPSLMGEYEIEGNKESHDLVLKPDRYYIERYKKYIGYRPIIIEFKGVYELDSNLVILHPETFTYSRVYFDSINSNSLVSELEKENYIDTLAAVVFHERIYLLGIGCPRIDTICVTDIELFLSRVVDGSDSNYRNFPFLNKECIGCTNSVLENIIPKQ